MACLEHGYKLQLFLKISSMLNNRAKSWKALLGVLTFLT